MVLAEAPRIYPVFTHHAKELLAAARFLIRRMERYTESEVPDDRFNTLMERYSQIIRTFLLLYGAKDPFVYLTLEERELVGRVNAWLKAHPDEAAHR